jgi:transcriptional regulator with XRE-family HTH domain
VSPDEIKALRKDLGCTARDLAAKLGVDQATVLAWENAELFPTKQSIKRMAVLRASGRSGATGIRSVEVMSALADPRTWEIVRKLVAHPAFRSEVTKLAERYADPAGS